MYIKGYDLLKDLCNNNNTLKQTILEGFKNGTIRLFNEEEWDKINSQNFMPPSNEIKSFSEIFLLGLNIGSCVYTSKQLSYSYDDVDRVSGFVPLLKGTKNAPNGGHAWLENETSIIDTSLMLVIDKSLKSKFGYIEEYRLTSEDLLNDNIYQARKKFVNDNSINKTKKLVK